jgi:hypothetical protein
MSSAERCGFTVVAVAWLLIVSASAVIAQEVDVPTVRTTTRLVQLNVVVLDKQGHPVRGLSLDDFQVFDNDARQKIVHFSESDGRVLGGIKDRVALALLPETFNDAETQGWFYPRSLWIEPKTERMRVVVRDLATGAVGSVSVPVEFERSR